MILDAKVQVLECPVAIATTDILVEMIKGRTIEEALKIKNDDISNALGGLSCRKLNCSVFAETLIKNALRVKKTNRCTS